MSYIEKTEDYGIININSPTHGKFKVIIDLDDVDKCKNVTWCILKSVSGKDKNYIEYYATNPKIGLLHRFIMNASEGMVIDHKDGNTLDNRKQNLRECTSSKNSMNQKKKKSKSGFRGVIWYNYHCKGKWMAYICAKQKRITLGYFDDLDEAIKVRKEAEIEYFGEYMRNEEKIHNL